MPFDLSQVLFIATANVMDTVPPALRDRMEVLELPGYTEEDKVEIARKFLLPRQREANGVAGVGVEVPDDTIRGVIRSYTREAGVRNLERELGALCRKTALRVAEGAAEGPLRIEPAALPDLLGPVRFEPELAERAGTPGVAVGLAWTPAGGDILFIESTRMPGKGQLRLTGSLGDVMRESAEAARTWLRAHAEALHVDRDALERSDLHLHVPAGAVPKDGPSAGVAMVTSLASLLTGRAAPPDVAMTGEITLRGKVLPVGGIKEKLLAAKRAGIRRVLLPEQQPAGRARDPGGAAQGSGARLCRYRGRRARPGAPAAGLAPPAPPSSRSPSAAAGCVTRAAHERQVEELRGEVARLDRESHDQGRSLEAMERERDRLLAEIEGLRDARESLQTELGAREKNLKDMRGSYDALVKDLEADVAATQLQIEQLTEGLSFRLPQDVLFPPGSAVLEPAGRRAVADIAARIKDREGRVEVQGHTDDRAIRGPLAQRYPTNWELAGARAASVVRVLEESGVAPDRLAAVSFGSTRPIASNETAEGRAQNRRIEVRVLPTARSPLPGAGAEGGTTAGAEAPPAGDAPAPPGAGSEPPPVEAGPPPADEGGTPAEVEAPARVEAPDERAGDRERSAPSELEAPAPPPE